MRKPIRLSVVFLCILVMLACFLLGMFVDRYKVFPYSSLMKIYRRTSERINNTYNRPIDPTHLKYFGKPRTLRSDKKNFTYSTSPNFEFIRDGIPVDKYFFGDSIKGTKNYFLNDLHAEKRAEIMKSDTREIEKILSDTLGIGIVPLGDIENVEKENLGEKENIQITYYKVDYSTGAVAQFYVAEPYLKPNAEPKKYLLAIHGCGSSPDKVLGLSEPDYTSSFGLEAAKMGWTVIAPYVLNYCDDIEKFDFLGSLNSGALLHGYELSKLQKIIDFIFQEMGPNRIDAYGISLGGQLVSLLSAYDERLENIIVSGATIFDFHYFWLTHLKNYNLPRTSFLAILRRHTNPDDFLLDFLEDGGKKIVLEYGAFDLEDKKYKKILDRLQANCKKKINDCDKRLFLNFFKGYHEPATISSLNLIK
jgi:hypothetical protein